MSTSEQPLPERVHRFFEEANEPEGLLADVFDDAAYQAASRMDPSLARSSELRLRLVGPSVQDGFYDSDVQDAIAGPLGREVAAAAGPGAGAARIGLVGVSSGSVVLHYRPHTPMVVAAEDQAPLEVSSADVAIRRVLSLHNMLEAGRPAAEIANATNKHKDLLRNARAVVEGLDRFGLDLSATWWSPSGQAVRSVLTEKGRTYAQGIFRKDDHEEEVPVSGLVTALDLDGLVTIRQGQLKYPVHVEREDVRLFELGETVHLVLRRVEKVDRVGLKAKQHTYNLVRRLGSESELPQG